MQDHRAHFVSSWVPWLSVLVVALLLVALGAWRAYRLAAMSAKAVHGGLRTPQEQLEWGLAIGDAAAVREALGRGGDPNRPATDDTHAAPPLIEAVGQPSSEILTLLLDAGADPNRASREGFSALHAAALLSRPSQVELLLDHGADPNGGSHPYKGATPLHMAAQKGDARTVELLLNAGADVHRRSATGLTPAQEARRRGHDSLAAVIEAHG